MKKYTRYSEGFKEQALEKVFSRGNEQSIQRVADSLNINLSKSAKTSPNNWMWHRPSSLFIVTSVRNMPAAAVKPLAPPVTISFCPALHLPSGSDASVWRCNPWRID